MLKKKKNEEKETYDTVPLKIKIFAKGERTKCWVAVSCGDVFLL
jgi:hypothetical protein